MLRLLHRYVLRELVGPATLGLVVFTFVVLLREFFDIIDLVLNRGVEAGTVLRAVLCMVPQVLTVTIPMAVLVAALLGFGRLATDREIMAMRTSGLDLWWLISPALAGGAVLSLLLGLFSVEVLPRLAIQLTDLKYQLLFQAVTSLEPGQNYDEFSSAGSEVDFMFEREGAQPGEMEGVFMLTVHPGERAGDRQLVALTAKRGRISLDLSQRAVRVDLSSGEVQLREPSGGERARLRSLEFEHMTQLFFPDLGRFRGGQYQKPPSEMRLGELNRAIAAESDPGRAAKLRVERQRRWVFPFSTLAFLLIGIPFGIVTRASGKGMGFGLSFLLILVYYGLLEWGSAIAQAGSPLAPLAMWSPNLILGAVGLALLWWVARL